MPAFGAVSAYDDGVAAAVRAASVAVGDAAVVAVAAAVAGKLVDEDDCYEQDEAQGSAVALGRTS